MDSTAFQAIPFPAREKSAELRRSVVLDMQIWRWFPLCQFRYLTDIMSDLERSKRRMG